MTAPTPVTTGNPQKPILAPEKIFTADWAGVERRGNIVYVGFGQSILGELPVAVILTRFFATDLEVMVKSFEPMLSTARASVERSKGHMSLHNLNALRSAPPARVFNESVAMAAVQVFEEESQFMLFRLDFDRISTLKEDAMNDAPFIGIARVDLPTALTVAVLDGILAALENER